jgi:predicted GTPase
MGADRPFTESEVQFLRYIRQWGKKVVFLVNKVDILAGEEEVKEVQSFVADNARAVLGVDSARVIPIAARSALAAKLDLLSSQGTPLL